MNSEKDEEKLYRQVLRLVQACVDEGVSYSEIRDCLIREGIIEGNQEVTP